MHKIQCDSVTLLSQLQNPNGTPFSTAVKKGAHITNDVSDIVGAQVPRRELRVGIDRPHYHDSSDIAGSSSKTLHPTEWRKPSESSLSPRGNKFNTARFVNPLNPTYNLPSFEAATFPEPKFLRDSINVRDIDGAYARKKKILAPRDLTQEAIPRSHSGWRSRYQHETLNHPPRDIMNIRDITDGKYHSKRVTDVLNPIHTIHGYTTEDDPLAHPFRPKLAKNTPFFSLRTMDIEGARSGCAGKSIVGNNSTDLRSLRSSNYIDDVEGAQADTHHHCIQTKRCTDPNVPQYTALDGRQVDASCVSVAKNIVFATLASKLEENWKKSQVKAQVHTSHTTAGIGNIGQLSSAQGRGPAVVVEKRRKQVIPGNNVSGRSIFTDHKAAQARNNEIELVRKLA
uniref:Uncharacterized protein AlNc14C345G10851 n=1 Tax=Albugo laibachii Nc14 TaxID=890382 RepID=F0WX96_9STRA|nr:conserved hypothetical protein [Albugo laibachii Nc14]|eukprot:CCA26088.1 conserved hypothetical protein [Albugo laibachii Nc14]